MNLGDLMLIIATLAILSAMATRLIALKTREKKYESYSAILSIITFASLSIAIFYLAYLFLTSDMTYSYVWHYSSRDLDALYKLTGVWAGAEGSFLLWIWLMSLALTIEVMLEPRKKYLSQKFHRIFQISICGVIFIFMLMLLSINPFAPTATAFLNLYPNGYGMSLLLQTPEMVIHPPVVFAGYAFAVCAFAAAFAYQMSGERNWHMISLPWARYSWLFLTLGIGIGAIWAYYVIGWGGYWAWDPVETASLFPWLMMTAFLHAQLRYSSKGNYAFSSPILGIAAFLSVLFATFVTRAGGIWSQSVHTFGGAAGGNAISRLVDLLGTNPIALGIFVLMMILLAYLLYHIYIGYRKEEAKEESPKNLADYISDKNNMTLTIILFLFSTLIGLFILLKNIDVSQATNYVEFNQKMSIFFVALMISMSVCLIWKFIGKEKTLWLAIILVIASIGLAMTGALTGAIDSLVAFSLPSYISAVAISAFKIAKIIRIKGTLRTLLRNVSPHLIHFGVALVLLSFVVSTNVQTVSVDGEIVSVNIGEQVNVGDYSVRLVDLTSRSAHLVGNGMIVEEEREAIVDVFRGGQLVEQGAILTNLFGFHQGIFKKLSGSVHVHSTFIEDLYLSFEWRDADTAVIQAKILPLMSTLWIGFLLLAIGIIIRTGAWKMEPFEKEAETKKKSEKKEEPIKGPEKDFESQVEEELKKFKESRKKD